jgi:hypothetical protein
MESKVDLEVDLEVLAEPAEPGGGFLAASTVLILSLIYDKIR